jgi:cytochrome c2
MKNESFCADVDPEAPGPIEARLAGADADRGKSESKICTTCHTVEKGGPNKVGPNLWDVVGRALASEPGFDFGRDEGEGREVDLR